LWSLGVSYDGQVSCRKEVTKNVEGIGGYVCYGSRVFLAFHRERLNHRAAQHTVKDKRQYNVEILIVKL